MPTSAGPRPCPCWSKSWFVQFGGLYLNAVSGRGRPCCRLGMFIGGSGGLCSFRRGHLASTKVWPVHIGGTSATRLTARPWGRSEEHTSELQSLMRISYAVFCLKKKKKMSTTKTQQRANSTQKIHEYNDQQVK